MPAYTSVTVFYDPLLAVRAGAPQDKIVEWLTTQLHERIKNPTTVYQLASTDDQGSLQATKAGALTYSSLNDPTSSMKA